MGSNVSRILGNCLASSVAIFDTPLDASLTAQAALLPLLSTQRCPLLSPHPKKFKYFRKLPPELRLMIWELVLPGERVVRIQEFTESCRHHNPSPLCRCIGSRACVPTLLQVCQETRYLALKFYTITFKNRLLKPTYFNPNVDILMFASVDDFFKFARPVAPHNGLEVTNPSYLSPYLVNDSLGFLGTPSRRYTDNEKIEDKVRHLAICRTNPLPFHQITGLTPWEEIWDLDLINLLGEFGNLDNLFIEGVYFEDTGLFPPPLQLGDLRLRSRLRRRWKLSKDETREFPELVIVGPTTMRQMRFKARESRLRSWARLAEHLP